MKPRVQSVELRYAQGLFDMTFLNGSAEATLALDDGSAETFSWYHDELTYTAGDFVGKTMEEIRQMHYERDIAYLRA